jgi:signal transduction histidine kinase
MKVFQQIGTRLYILAAVIICSVMFLGGLLVEIDIDHTRETVLELGTQSERVQYYDEVLTKSALMAALTGDLKWEERYRVYEKKLDESIKIIAELMPLQEGREGSDAVDEANQKLIALENQAFDLVRAGKKSEAVDVLFSEDYRVQKEIYAKGQVAVREATDAFMESSENRHDHVHLPILTMIGVLSVLFIVFSVHKGLRTQQKLHAQEKLSIEYRQMAEVGKFSANIAHEINNALQPIMGLSEIIEKGLARDERIDPRYAEYAKLINESAMHAREVVENVLRMARGTNAQIEKWNALRLFSEAVDFAAQILPETIVIERDFSDLEAKDEIILVNKTDVSRIVINLFKNATQAMQGNGILTVNASVRKVDDNMAKIHGMEVGPCLVLLIKDNGAGMDEKMMDSIFNPFFTTKEEGQGTGLGLSMAYGLMRQYGGTILVQSKVGKGASFYLYFPLRVI